MQYMTLSGRERAVWARAGSRLASTLLVAAVALQPPPALGDSEAAAPVLLDEVAMESGLNFVHRHHPTPSKHLIETMAGGLAVFDYDADGLPDVFFTNGAKVPELTKAGAGDWNRLFRNQGGLKFTDITEQAGVAGAGYSMGAAAADYDNDGDIDLFVSGVYRNLLYQNGGDGTFEEVGEASGIGSQRWAVAGGWFDYDNDGWLDLFVVNYTDWDPDTEAECKDPKAEVRTYCHPRYYKPIPNQLYRNVGGRRFEDVSKEVGISTAKGRGMSVAFADYDADGWMDAFVTNDNLPNFLFRNQGDGTFEESALLAGVAFPASGQAVASMGADFQDYDNDGRPDIAVTALFGETFPLFHNEGDGFFDDAGYGSRMASLTSQRSGWGVGFGDFNNDGWKDLFTANSHVNDLIHLFEPTTPYEESNRLFLNLGDGSFQDVSSSAGDEFGRTAAHRGSAIADLDRDGRLDVVVSVLGGRAELWRNVSPGAGNWLNLQFAGSQSNRDGVGAKVVVDGQHAVMSSAVGYASSTHDGLHFGLSGPQAVKVEIHWPSGRIQVLKNVKGGQALLVKEPDG